MGRGVPAMRLSLPRSLCPPEAMLLPHVVAGPPAPSTSQNAVPNNVTAHQLLAMSTVTGHALMHACSPQHRPGPRYSI